MLRKEAASDLTCPGPARMPLLLTDSTSCERSTLRSSTAGEGRDSVGTQWQGPASAESDSELQSGQ